MVKIKLSEEELLLLPEKAIWWERKKALLVSDIHLGKSGHFRKAGIAVPRALNQEDLAVLSDLIYCWHPETLYILGDLFHSEMNSDWNWFSLWRTQFPKLLIHLIKGNHDILHDRHFLELGIELYADSLVVPPFRLSHHPVSSPGEGLEDGLYRLSGHIHPGVRLSGMARQSLSLPCFYFSKTQGILPAFGRFTGIFALRIKASDRVYPILNGKVIQFMGSI